MKKYHSNHLITSKDLNHHGTLFAGQTACWFVENSFVAASISVGNPAKVVCVNIHGMQFKSSVRLGDVVCFSSRIAYVGKSRIIVYTRVTSETRDIIPVEGFVSFVCLNETTSRPEAHGIVLDEPEDLEEQEIRKKALEIV